MNYYKTNKEAWNEAFIIQQKSYVNNPIDKKVNNLFEFFNQDTIEELKNINLKNKNIAQFCCNNGRELLSISKAGIKSGIGFDISENFIKEANLISRLNNINCEFVCTNIIDIGNEYKSKFDLVFSTIGTICWFKNLNDFFNKVNFVLKPDGFFLLNEVHPITNLFAMENESEFDKNNPEKIIYSYFKNDEWINNSGMDYIGNTLYKSKTFISFSHTFSDIINAMINNKIQIVKINEYNYSLHDFKAIDKNKIPLSMIVIGKKMQPDFL